MRIQIKFYVGFLVQVQAFVLVLVFNKTRMMLDFFELTNVIPCPWNLYQVGPKVSFDVNLFLDTVVLFIG